MSIRLGMKLKQARESMGFSVEEIERRTHIEKKYLNAIEEGQLDLVPSSIYVRSYIRSYASVVGEDPYSLMQLLSNLEQSKKSMEEKESASPRRRSRLLDMSGDSLPPRGVNRIANNLKKDTSTPLLVSQFVTSQKVEDDEHASASPEIKDEKIDNEEIIISEVAATSEMFSQKIPLPMNLPQPEELGIKKVNNEVKLESLPSRRSVYKSRLNKRKDKATYDKVYAWLLIISGTLLVSAVIYGLFYSKVST